MLTPLVQILEGYANKKKSRSHARSFEPLKWNEDAKKAFKSAKTAIAQAALLRLLIPGAPLSIWVDPIRCCSG